MRLFLWSNGDMVCRKDLLFLGVAEVSSVSEGVSMHGSVIL